MKITKSKKKLFSDAKRVTEAIREKLKSKSKGDDKVDLTNLAKKLSARREKALSEEEEGDEE